MPSRTSTAVALIVLVLAGAGCGGDDEGGSQANTSTGSSAPAPAPSGGSTETTMAPDGTPTTRTQPPSSNGAATTPSGEDQPGGAGDEVPNSTQALLTGKGGKITPPTVAVPPFIAITVELRSADGEAYALSGGGKQLSASGGKPATASFDGLRTGRSITLRGPQGTVRITANAEPGP